MKTFSSLPKRDLACGLAALLAGLGSATAATTFYTSTSYDNSAAYGLTPDFVVPNPAFTDGGIGNAPTPNTNTTITAESIRPIILDERQSVGTFSFGNLGTLTSGDVISAFLYATIDQSFGEDTWSIFGIAPANTILEDPGASWTEASPGTAWKDGTGANAANVLGALGINNYGSFVAPAGGASTAGDTFLLDVTTMVQDYLAGDIAGIAIVNNTPTDSFATSDHIISFRSKESNLQDSRPGLLVDAIPEPSTALLGILGGLGLCVRRRRSA